MKKATSFLLALVMVVSLFPGTALTVSAQTDTTPTGNGYYSNVIVYEGFESSASAMTANRLGTSADEHYTVLGGGTARFKTGPLSDEGSYKEVAITDFGSAEFDFQQGFEVAFEVTFNDLVVADTAAAGSNLAVAGFSVDVRAASRCRYGFHADADGNIYVSQLGSTTRFDTGADLGDKYLKVRIVADDQMNSTVTVNGHYVGRFSTPTTTRPNGDYFILYTGTRYRTDDTHVNDVTLYDIKLSQAPAADDEMQAYYTFDEPYLDGAFNEVNWPFDGGNTFALLSDEDYLYVAVNNSDPDPDFVINGVSLAVDPTAGTVNLSDGTWAGKAVKSASDNKFEIKIPLKSVLGLDYAPGQKVGFTYGWGGFDGAVVLAGRAMVDYNGFDGTLPSGSATDEVYAVESGGALQLKTGTYSAGGYQELYHKMISPQQMEMTAPFEMEFTADFTDLTVPVNSANWYTTGVSVELRADPCYHYGFHADTDGKIYVTQRMSASTEVTRVDTGLVVGATGVNVRLATDESGATTIYINDVACAETLPASTFECPETGGRGYYEIENSTRNRNTDSDHVNDVTLYDLILTQDVPDPVWAEHPMADSGSGDITAYLNPNGIEPDGVLSEAEWYTPYSVYGTGTAPSGLLGVSWGDGNLYVGGETKADQVGVRIGGTLAVADLRYISAASGSLAVSNSGFEWVIPLSKFNLPDGVLDEEVSCELILADYFRDDQANLQGTLHFSGEQLLLGDTGRNYSGTDYYLGTGNGHVHLDRTDDGYALTAEGLNSLKDGSIRAGGTFAEKYSIPVDYASGAVDLTMTMTVNDLPNIADTYGMRGMIFELCGDNMRAVFALRRDADGEIWMDIRDTLDVQSHSTGVYVGTGEAVTFRFAMDDKQSISLYVDGAFVYAFAPIDRRDLTATAVQMSVPHFMWGAYNGSRQLNADGTVSVVDVVVHDLRLTKHSYADDEAVLQAALDQITQESILNGGDPEDVTAMTLPTCVYVDNIGEAVTVGWSATDKLTGRTAYSVDVSSGAVTRLTATQAFDLKVTARYGTASAGKTFTFQTKGTEATEGTVALIENDDAPATGGVTTWDSDRYVYLDDTHNSIVVDQGSSLPFNRITLRDTDNYSRVSQRHLGVFISDDGEKWTKVTGWMLHQSGRNYTLYNLNETARYVKVHCYHDDLDLVEGPTFYNKVSEMIKVSKETYLPGAAGKFTNSKTFTAANDTAEEQKDVPVYISLDNLGAAANQYQAGCADFRFTIDGTTDDTTDDITLAHWYNGTDGFYVRVPSIPANGSVEVTAHWGCSRAEDYSDGEAVFEVTYGNVSLINISRETYEASGGDLEQSMLSHGRPFTFPNGDVIVVARTMKSASNAAVFRSTDGGHTFAFDKMAYQDGDYISTVAFDGHTYRSSGFGGFLWDGKRDEDPDDDYVGRLYVITYNGQGGNSTDYRLVLNYTDDYGETWSEPAFLSLEGASDIIKASTKNSDNPQSVVSTLKNSEARITDTGIATRAILYGDGLTMKDADGTGPNVDYVIVHSDTVYSCDTGKVADVAASSSALYNVTTAIYSTDGGETWTCSDSLMSIPGVDQSGNSEDGLSEFGLAQLDDGTLRTVMRAQQEGNYYLYEGISEDYGATWTAEYSEVISSNTSPVLTKLGDDRLQMWSACTALGQKSYRRSPMHLGLSTDQYETFDKIIDLTFATAFDTVQASQARKTQPGIAIYTDTETNKTSAFVSYWDQTWHQNDGAWSKDAGQFMEKGGTMGMVIEEFDEMVYGNKGAWDDFEDASLKYQGWIVDADGTIELSRQQAVSGKYSMKVVDNTSGSPAHALRQVPSMKYGTVGAKLMVPTTNEAPFVMELKAAYNYDHMKFTIAAIFVAPGGSVGYVGADGTQHVLTNVVAGSWNDYAVSFDVSAGTGTLYVNGSEAGTFTLPSETTVYDLHGNEKNYAEVHGVTAVQFNQAAATSARGDCVYVDDFFANELTGVSRALEEDSAAQTTIGRFMAIVRKIIEVDGEQVELVEWGWVPGL